MGRLPGRLYAGNWGLSTRPSTLACGHGAGVATTPSPWHLRPLALSFTALATILAFDAGCSSTSADEEAPASSAGDSALTLRKQRLQRSPAGAPAEARGAPSQRPPPGRGPRPRQLARDFAEQPVDLSGTKDAVPRSARASRVARSSRFFFAFGGVSASASAIAEFTVSAETVWDLTHQQQAVFDGREYAITPGVKRRRGHLWGARLD